jgi:hypothetical protein
MVEDGRQFCPNNGMLASRNAPAISQPVRVFVSFMDYQGGWDLQQVKSILGGYSTIDF